MFLAEIIVGYITGSLALIADAFHMLSDVLSQIIALYAIHVRYPFCIAFGHSLLNGLCATR